MDLHKYIEDYAFDGYKEKYPEVIEYLKYSSEFFAVSRGLARDIMNDGVYYYMATRLADVNMMVMQAKMTPEDYQAFIGELDRLIKLERLMNEEDKPLKPQQMLAVDENGNEEILTVIEVEDDGEFQNMSVVTPSGENKVITVRKEDDEVESHDWDLKDLDNFRS